ncbi:hypothetical protein E3N86_00120 [Cryobacterium sp. Hz7]|uniref:hypothetical protein n=1 Tax=Cryobacterium sp. Hz7 TaxID=1259166 RepID=UPI00106CCB85|nr:hypothetical protein [Cryobacterium sp. Hz7]TFB67214.1 hypothetical protein E3N86_00120 [Cryobacterium sp. Hz7]
MLTLVSFGRYFGKLVRKTFLLAHHNLDEPQCFDAICLSRDILMLHQNVDEPQSLEGIWHVRERFDAAERRCNF